MKKVFATVALCAFALLLGVNATAQQGSWVGQVKYKLTWKGNVPKGVPEEWSTKIYKNLEGNDFITYLTLTGLMKSVHNSDNNVVTAMIDFSMLPDEGVYEGMSGKWYFRDKVDLSKATEKVKYEYTGNEKEIAGVKCLEVKVTEEGKDEPEVIWVTKEIGPKVCLTYYAGLDAFPMEFPIQISPELTVTFAVTELLKGKASQADLMLESGYEEIAKEDFQDWIQKLIGAAQQGGQGDDDDDM